MQKLFANLFKNPGILLIALFINLFFSCKVTYQPSYFNDVSNKADTVINISRNDAQPIIKYGDILSLNVTTLDQLTGGQVYQTPVPGGIPDPTASTSLNVPQGNQYAVNKDGIIEIPLIGKVNVAGKTIDEAKEILRTQYSTFFKSFSIDLSFVNHKFTVLGEVNHPGTFNLPTNQVTIYDALGYAGDITVYGKKDNVLIMRDSSDTKRHLVRLNLNSKNVISSPYYYLKENDVIYIEPGRAKLASTDAYRNRNLAILTTSLSIVVIVVSRLVLK